MSASTGMNQTAMRGAFPVPRRWAMIAETFHIPMAKVPVTQPELLSRRDRACLLPAPTPDSHHDIAEPLYATGLRVFEATCCGCVMKQRD
jgi:site-specific recombinase XerD